MAVKRKLFDYECEHLISEVKIRPCLWNDKHNDFKNCAVTKTLWKEIGRSMNMSGDECKKKWKNLKDTYRKKMHTLQSGSVSASPPHHKWKFETLMEFLQEVVQPSPRTGSLSSVTVKEEEDSILDEEITDQETSQLCSTVHSGRDENERFSTSSHPSIKKSMRTKEELRQKMELEEKKINAIIHLGKRTDDQLGDDDHFFLSLLPFIRRLNDVEKLQLRSKIHDCVLEAVRDHEAKKERLEFSARRASESSSGSVELR